MPYCQKSINAYMIHKLWPRYLQAMFLSKNRDYGYGDMSIIKLTRYNKIKHMVEHVFT